MKGKMRETKHKKQQTLCQEYFLQEEATKKFATFWRKTDILSRMLQC